MSDPSALRTLLDPTSAPPPEAWLWPLVALGAAVCGLCLWLMRAPLRAMGEPWGELPSNMLFPGLAAAIVALILPELVGVAGGVSEWPDHGPLLSGLVTISVAGTALGALAVMQSLKPPHRRLAWLEFKPANLVRTAHVYALMLPALLGLMLAVVAAGRLAGLDVSPQPQVVQLTGRDSGLWIAGVYVLAGAGAPLREELIFRLVAYGLIASLATQGRWTHPARIVAVVVSVGLFVAAHGDWWVGVLPLALLGGVLTALFAHSRSIWPPVVLHAAHNCLVLTLQFFVL